MCNFSNLATSQFYVHVKSVCQPILITLYQSPHQRDFYQWYGTMVQLQDSMHRWMLKILRHSLKAGSTITAESMPTNQL